MDLLRPLLHSFMELALHQGLLPEPHAQNVLFIQVARAGGTGWTPVWRDLLGFYCDSVRRAELGLGGSESIPVRRRLADVVQAQRTRSVLFDHMLYEYLVGPLLLVARQYGADDLFLLDECRRTLNTWLREAPDYLPEGSWFSRSLEPAMPGEWLIEQRRHGWPMIRGGYK